jgi:protein-disulfide isomerase
MPSGKQSKARRRAAPAPPPVRSKGATRSRQASPRVLAIAGGIVAVIALAVVLAVVFTRGSSNGSASANAPAVGSIATGLPGSADVHALYKGIPQSDQTLGKAGAPVTMTEFIDLQCPYCQQFETQTMPGIVQKYVRSGKLRVVMQPWAFIGPDSDTGQSATLAAAKQNKAFDYASILYANQGVENTGWLNDTMVTSAAASIPGLMVHQLLTDKGSASVAGAAKAVDELVKQKGVNSTPTLYVGKTGTPGKRVTLKSPTDSATLTKAIDQALAQQAS